MNILDQIYLNEILRNPDYLNTITPSDDLKQSLIDIILERRSHYTVLWNKEVIIRILKHHNERHLYARRLTLLDQLHFNEILINPEYLKTITPSNELSEAILRKSFNFVPPSNIKWDDELKQKVVNSLIMSRYVPIY